MIIAGAELPEILMGCAIDDPQVFRLVGGLEQLLAFFEPRERIGFAGDHENGNLKIPDVIDRFDRVRRNAHSDRKLDRKKR